MNSTNTAVSEPEPGGMSEVGRLTGVFWEPKPVFQDLSARPRWWAPLILSVIVSMALIILFSQIVTWETFLEQEFATNPQLQEMPEAQKSEIIAQQAGITGSMVLAAAALGGPIIMLLVAGVFLLVFRAAGAPDLSFRQSFAIICYGWLPYALFGLLAIVTLYFINPADFNLKNPLPFNAGWFMDPGTSAGWLVALATAIDLFTLWVLALVALGYSVTSRKMNYGKAFGVVIALWLVVVVTKVGWAALFG